MAYKTIMLKIYKPTKAKRNIMDGAISSYAQALEFLLNRYRDDIIALAALKQPATRTSILSLLEKEVLKELNTFDAEPFKDSIKMEFAIIVANYLAQRRTKASVRFPTVLPPSIYANASGKSRHGKSVDCPHPLYFGRYATNRDYCLLYDENTKRFYAQLYLLNLKNRLVPEKEQGRLQLNYITSGFPAAEHHERTRRFIMVPLAFGKHQLRDLNRLLEYPKNLKTARLKKIGGDYFLLVNIICDSPKTLSTDTFMGIARSAGGGLHYTVCDSNDTILESGYIAKPLDSSQKLYLLAKSVTSICQRFHPQMIVENNGGKNDRLMYKKSDLQTPLTTTEYKKLVKILSYKLPNQGLPSPIEISANRLFITCPVCTTVSQESRVSGSLFICLCCGHAFDAEALGSLALIKKMKSYHSNQVPVILNRYPGKKVFTNRILDFECALPDNSADNTPMFYELNLLVHRTLNEKLSKQKYAMIKKLKSVPNITEAVRIVEKN